jgi:hypothetical protein
MGKPKGGNKKSDDNHTLQKLLIVTAVVNLIKSIIDIIKITIT